MTTTNTISPVTLSALQKLTANGTGSLTRDEAADFSKLLEEIERDPDVIKQAVPAIRQGIENGLRIITQRENEATAQRISDLFLSQRSIFGIAHDEVHDAKEHSELGVDADLWSYIYSRIPEVLVLKGDDYAFLFSREYSDRGLLLSFGKEYFDALALNTVEIEKAILDTEERENLFNSGYTQLLQKQDWPPHVKVNNERFLLSCKLAFINIANKLMNHAITNKPREESV